MDLLWDIGCLYIVIMNNMEICIIIQIVLISSKCLIALYMNKLVISVLEI